MLTLLKDLDLGVASDLVFLKKSPLTETKLSEVFCE